MANIVVIGAGLAGMPAVYELRHALPSRHSVTLICDQPKFTFIPGLIQVALGLKPLDQLQEDLAPLAQRQKLNWVGEKVISLDPIHRQITVASRQIVPYDYLVIATGASLAFDLVPGLGPERGFTHSVCKPNHAVEACQAWSEFLAHPGPLVIGAAPGAGCFGPAYEFALLADHELRRHGIRDQVPMTLITPEPYVGHLGVSGLSHSQSLTTSLLEHHNIAIVDNAAITSVAPHQIILADGRTYAFSYAMILPAFRGAAFLRTVPGLTNEQGFIPVLPSQRHPRFPEIYAAGVVTHVEQPEKNLVPIGIPKTGQMAESMAIAAAHNICVDLGVLRDCLKVPTLDALCFAEFGPTGIAYIAAPVLPDPKTGKRNRSYALQGAWVVWVKAMFEKYFMAKIRWGIGMPWYEKLGLWIFFGLRLQRDLTEAEQVLSPSSPYQASEVSSKT
ncbi:NAD(P)/FAD-dependent oxidoreductase [Lyngbya confervoides]|uniref:Sulfide-quinone reductase n=1 Tax=Lyngbya confervoides BDU141951 TaxID=1574623 RepID=A0ABD4T1G9_9CYAN|nr:FAD-dependent oxidoreductase [Lyngbya confervoides]MCM1982445.1 FAD-dependent oxidoreductase [Lyngbya confervoides BDU141951]